MASPAYCLSRERALVSLLQQRLNRQNALCEVVADVCRISPQAELESERLAQSCFVIEASECLQAIDDQAHTTVASPCVRGLPMLPAYVLQHRATACLASAVESHILRMDADATTTARPRSHAEVGLSIPAVEGALMQIPVESIVGTLHNLELASSPLSVLFDTRRAEQLVEQLEAALNNTANPAPLPLIDGSSPLFTLLNDATLGGMATENTGTLPAAATASKETSRRQVLPPSFHGRIPSVDDVRAEVRNRHEQRVAGWQSRWGSSSFVERATNRHVAARRIAILASLGGILQLRSCLRRVERLVADRLRYAQAHAGLREEPLLKRAVAAGLLITLGVAHPRLAEILRMHASESPSTRSSASSDGDAATGAAEATIGATAAALLASREALRRRALRTRVEDRLALLEAS